MMVLMMTNGPLCFDNDDGNDDNNDEIVQATDVCRQ